MTALTVNWRLSAACREVPADLFFPEGAAGPALAQAEEAQAVCAACPVRRQCLDWALRHRVTDGIWGGTTEQERARLGRTAPSGNPALCRAQLHPRTGPGRCLACKAESEARRRPPSGLGRGNTLVPRERDARGWFVKAAREEAAA